MSNKRLFYETVNGIGLLFFLMNRNTREENEAPKKSAKMKQFLVSNREEKCRISMFGCEIGGNLVK